MVSSDTVWPEHLFTDLDRTGPVPLYFQVSSRLETAIRSGELPAGSRLENEIAIGQRLGLSRPTVRRAIQELVDVGLLVRRRGIGTQVVQGQITRQVELTSLYEDLKNTSQEPGTRVLLHEISAASETVAERLRVEPGSDVVHLRRLRTTGGIAIAILENYLPAAFADITTELLQELGLYQILRARGVTIRVANQRIGARRAEHDESELLGVERHGPLLTMERIAFDDAGEAIEYGHHCYRPDMYSFETTLVAK
ncbi:GntR family transcriptional regulator [Subtercola boreus]|uniref:GntR family transcriptional regulator n=1 Tax=Subtercola boreus TaxID=120213 RepID=A0A3E0VUV0_9MICO|nr:GntR family transcriptional regulator [Subtercola boreus]RFA13531.1 GntR family transcriptional regulator [Subtercola boreus]